jgi:RHS repeat-associated protein
MLTNGAGVAVWRSSHESFGKAVVDEDPDGDSNLVTFNVRFPGQYADAETGLHDNYFRTYDPAAGRYLSADPIGQLGGMNLYRYARNNPLGYFDPLGDDPKRTPAQGQPPGSRQTYPDPKTGGKTVRDFGDDGRAKTDYDYGHPDHGAGDPHAHDWDWSKPDPRQPGRPLTPDEPGPDPGAPPVSPPPPRIPPVVGPGPSFLPAIFLPFPPCQILGICPPSPPCS